MSIFTSTITDRLAARPGEPLPGFTGVLNGSVDSSNIIVLKFGSSVLPSEAALPRAVAEISRWIRRGYKVVAVVSAFGRTTDSLRSRSLGLSPTPDPDAYASLLATGEAQAVASLTLALDQAGVPATLFEGSQLGVVVEGDQLDGDPVRLDLPALRRGLARTSVAVVPGFVARLPDGRPALLGRGCTKSTAFVLTIRSSS